MNAGSSGFKYRLSPAQARTKSRRAGLQALYQWHVGKQSLTEIEIWFLAEQDLRGADLNYFQELLHRIPACIGELDQRILPFTERVESNIDTVELTALRIGTYELIYRPDIPYRVVIDEAVELVKRFGADEGYRFVNGVIDRLARKLRSAEIINSDLHDQK
ncbi:transcription antitermination protein NusB [Gammaproteobacteria bacterium]